MSQTIILRGDLQRALAKRLIDQAPYDAVVKIGAATRSTDQNNKIVAANPAFVWLLGGNQNNAVNIAAFSRHQFTAFRWPEGQPMTLAPLPSVLTAGGASEA